MYYPNLYNALNNVTKSMMPINKLNFPFREYLLISTFHNEIVFDVIYYKI